MRACACGDSTVTPWHLAGQRDVVDVAPLPVQEALILDPPHRLSDAELGHVRSPLVHGVIWFPVNVSGASAARASSDLRAAG